MKLIGRHEQTILKPVSAEIKWYVNMLFQTFFLSPSIMVNLNHFYIYDRNKTINSL